MEPSHPYEDMAAETKVNATAMVIFIVTEHLLSQTCMKIDN